MTQRRKEPVTLEIKVRGKCIATYTPGVEGSLTLCGYAAAIACLEGARKEGKLSRIMYSIQRTRIDLAKANYDRKVSKTPFGSYKIPLPVINEKNLSNRNPGNQVPEWYARELNKFKNLNDKENI